MYFKLSQNIVLEPNKLKKKKNLRFFRFYQNKKNKTKTTVVNKETKR